jgi:hypothetical protein
MVKFVWAVELTDCDREKWIVTRFKETATKLRENSFDADLVVKNVKEFYIMAALLVHTVLSSSARSILLYTFKIDHAVKYYIVLVYP